MLKDADNREVDAVSMTTWPQPWWDFVRQLTCGDESDIQTIVPYSEEWFIAQGRGDEF